MSDQGAGGGIESHMSTHSRTKSENETIPVETAAEARSAPTEADTQDQFAPPLPAALPRGTQAFEEDRSSPPANMHDVSLAPLSRNPSSASNSSRPTEIGGHTPEISQRSYPTRPLEPPVTKATLSELDVNKIIHNPKLRHDINFDPELHFRPNLDGEKGRRKQEKAGQFWDTLLNQLEQFVGDRDSFAMNDDEWCLPSLLKAVREIIQTLVPQRDREFLNEGLNVELLMQQFNRGIADLEKLASWLSSVLKLHCAPMRDEWVDEMYQELSNGNREGNMAELVKGMRSLLSVLEAMKLDVANHQIRCLRPVLIEDTVHFEQRFFLKKIQLKKLSISAAKLWYKNACTQAVLSPSASQAFGETAVFFEALSKLMLPSTPVETVPNTFLFDEERILKLRSDMHDAIALEICMRKYEDLERLSATLGTTDFNFNAPPSSRPSSYALSDRGSDASSPRNSGLFGPISSETGQLRPKTLGLYGSLLALLHTAPPASRPVQRWEGLAQSMALQILRTVNIPALTLPGFEEQLTRLVTDVDGDMFREVEAHFLSRLVTELAKRIREFKSLSGVGLFSVATGGRIHGPGRTWEGGRDEILREPGLTDGANNTKDARDDAGMDDMAVRLAHLGILHWRVWSQLAYVGNAEDEHTTPLNITVTSA